MKNPKDLQDLANLDDLGIVIAPECVGELECLDHDDAPAARPEGADSEEQSPRRVA